MSEPVKIIRLDQRTRSGDLRVSDLLLIKKVLSDWGYVLLPSDTCYALATYADQVDCERNLNRILRREPDSISLCAADFQDAMRWIDSDNLTAVSLLAHLTPGPITVVCEASDLLVRNSMFFQSTIAAKNGLIGIRISDSSVERQVSGTSNDFLISSTAVRNLETRAPVTDFDEALEIVRSGIESIPKSSWVAIEGKDLGGIHSTVVRAFRDGSFEIMRSGAVSSEEIEVAARTTPPTLFDSSARAEVEELAKRLRSSTLFDVPESDLDRVIVSYLDGEITRKEAVSQLRALQSQVMRDRAHGNLAGARSLGVGKGNAPLGHHFGVSKARKIAIFVALEEELEVLTQVLELRRNSGQPAASGKLGSVIVDVLCPREIGRVAATAEVLSYLSTVSQRPDMIACVGLAGGFVDSGVRVGAVICASKVVDLANRKVIDNDRGAAQVEFRRQDFECSRAVYSVVTSSEFDKEAWASYCKVAYNWPSEHSPSIREGKIVSVDEVVASDSHRQKLIESGDKLLGVEMEAGGVCFAGNKYGIKCCVLRVVSDFADPAKADDHWRRLGMNTLSELIKRLPLDRVIEVANAPL